MGHVLSETPFLAVGEALCGILLSLGKAHHSVQWGEFPFWVVKHLPSCQLSERKGILQSFAASPFPPPGVGEISRKAGWQNTVLLCHPPFLRCCGSIVDRAPAGLLPLPFPPPEAASSICLGVGWFCVVPTSKDLSKHLHEHKKAQTMHKGWDTWMYIEPSHDLGSYDQSC